MVKWTYQNRDIEAEYSWGTILLYYKGLLLKRIGTRASNYAEFVHDVEKHINSEDFKSKIDTLEANME